MSKPHNDQDADATLTNAALPPSKGKAVSPAPLIPLVPEDEPEHGALSTAAAALRVKQLQADARQAADAASARGPRPTGGLFQASCASDVLFLVDATLSMNHLIAAVRRQVRDIVDEIQDAFCGEADVRLAVVAYRDHETADPIAWIDFTRDPGAVFAFLGALGTQQSEDACEDVLGGLDRALQLAWRHPTRCIMHLGDAPAHGRDNHRLGSDPRQDRYYAAPEPHGLTLPAVAARMVAARIHYVFFRMNPCTDRMLYNLFRHYAAAAPGARLAPGNAYAAKAEMAALDLRDARDARRGSSHRRPGHRADDTIAGGLHFEEVDMGAAYSALGRLVVRGVAASSSRTAMRLTASLTASRAARGGGQRSKQARKMAALGAVAEDEPADFSSAEKDEEDGPKDVLTAEKETNRSGTATTGSSDATLVAGQAGRVGVYDDDDNDDDDGSWQRHRAVPVEDGPPRWNDKGWLDQTLRVKAYSPDVVHLQPEGADGADSLLDRMMASDDNIPISTTDLTILRRSRPFAQGTLRTVAYARTAASTTPLVVKAFKTPRPRADLVEDMRMQALAKAFAREFSALVGDDQYALDFVTATCLEVVAVEAAAEAGVATPSAALRPTRECLLLEPLLATANGRVYTKYNNNCGGVSALDADPGAAAAKSIGGGLVYLQRNALHKVYEMRMAARAATASTATASTAATAAAAQAFSHYTFERSRGRLLVVDLQGVGRVLTDPVVHTRDPARFALSDTNLNEDGFKLFFATHRCGSLCRGLGLLDAAAVGAALARGGGAATDVPGARPTYYPDRTPAQLPAVRDRRRTAAAVCCANKLCARPVPGNTAATAASSAHTSAHMGPPGFAWCARCWPQLAATATTRVCAAGAGSPPHEFAVSAFFFASQGQVLPDACAAHGGSGAGDAAQFGPEPRQSLLGRLRSLGVER